MTTLRNHARERLMNGELALGFGVRTSRNVEIAKIAKTAGYDWLFIDLEHNAMSVETAQQIAVAALDAGVTPLVGVPYDEHDLAMRVLRGGALGTVTAHVQTAADARRLVDLQMFPPLGHRGTSGAMAQFDFRPTPVEELTRLINAASLIVVMLESQEAIDNAAEIAAVEGIDVLLIGSGDLSMDLGIPGQQTHEKMRACYQTVIAACRAHGKWAGCSGIIAEDAIAGYVQMGVRFVLGGNDIGFMLAAAGKQSQALRGITLTN
jgi:2-keto-3-deoxy-L-rhamnonate aldolase RhmA